MSQRATVLSLYRRALRLSRTWEAEHERAYIADEARRLLRRNQNLTASADIDAKVREFDTRIETALHYKIPYPRPVNVSPGATGKAPEFVTPVYLDSYDTRSEKAAGRRMGREKPVYD